MDTDFCSKMLNEARRVLSEEINAISNTREKLDENFAIAVEIIINAKKIVVTGVGKSGLIGRKIAATFSSIGKPAVFLNPVEALHGDIGMVESGDCVIMLSKSGSTEEIIRLVPYLKSRKAKIISISGNRHSFLATNADASIDASVTKEACPLNVTPTSSTTVALAIGDALASCYMIEKNVTQVDFSKQHPLGQLGKNITLRVKDIMHKNNNLPKVKVGSTFRDSIIENTNKGLGCVCVVDELERLVGIITDGDIRRALQKIDDIRNYRVDDVMTKSPVSISPEAYIGEALTIMENRQSQISVLPVIDEESKCIGVVRIHDIIRSSI
jgi:arabinose-5-phosphate isomerase